MKKIIPEITFFFFSTLINLSDTDRKMSIKRSTQMKISLSWQGENDPNSVPGDFSMALSIYKLYTNSTGMFK